jgi:hypothetical protein
VGLNIAGDEKGQAQIFLDRLFQAFGQPDCLGVGGAAKPLISSCPSDRALHTGGFALKTSPCRAKSCGQQMRTGCWAP